MPQTFVIQTDTNAAYTVELQASFDLTTSTVHVSSYQQVCGTVSSHYIQNNSYFDGIRNLVNCNAVGTPGYRSPTFIHNFCTYGRIEEANRLQNELCF